MIGYHQPYLSTNGTVYTACNWTVVLHFAMLTVFFFFFWGGGGKELQIYILYNKFF